MLVGEVREGFGSIKQQGNHYRNKRPHGIMALISAKYVPVFWLTDEVVRKT